MPDYGNYKLSWKQWLVSLGLFLSLDMVIAILFYNTWVAAVVLLPTYILFLIYYSQMLAGHRRKVLKLQFRQWMMILYSLITSGASLENAFRESYKEIHVKQTDMDLIYSELGFMVKKMNLNVNVLQCLEDFANRSFDEDIYDFYEVICIAKQQGGSMRHIVQTSVHRISERIEMECEIQTLIAAKKQEFMIMVCIPAGMILYMRIGSPELMTVLYTGAAGRVIMTLALIIYLLAVYWGMTMTRIDL